MKGASPELEPQATNRSPNPFSPLLRHFSLPASTVPAEKQQYQGQIGGDLLTLSPAVKGPWSEKTCVPFMAICVPSMETCVPSVGTCVPSTHLLQAAAFRFHRARLWRSARSLSSRRCSRLRSPCSAPLVPGHFVPPRCQVLVIAS